MTTTAGRTVGITPTFRATADMLIALLESGTPTGQDFAKSEIRRWGTMLDAIAAEQATATKEAGQ